MIIDVATQSPNQTYFLMMQALIPRPIAWILSDNGGSYNLAPFSYFNAVSSDPPVIMVSIGTKSDAQDKDTRRNIIERNQFVVHIAHVQALPELNASSAELASGASEIDALSLPTASFGDFRLPRLRDCRVALACERYQVVEIGTQAVIFGRVVSIYVEDGLAVPDGRGRLRIDPLALDPLCRLGGDQYAGLGVVQTLARPSPAR